MNGLISLLYLRFTVASESIHQFQDKARKNVWARRWHRKFKWHFRSKPLSNQLRINRMKSECVLRVQPRERHKINSMNSFRRKHLWHYLHVYSNDRDASPKQQQQTQPQEKNPTKSRILQICGSNAKNRYSCRYTLSSVSLNTSEHSRKQRED